MCTSALYFLIHNILSVEVERIAFIIPYPIVGIFPPLKNVQPQLKITNYLNISGLFFSYITELSLINYNNRNTQRPIIFPLPTLNNCFFLIFPIYNPGESGSAEISCFVAPVLASQEAAGAE